MGCLFMTPIIAESQVFANTNLTLPPVSPKVQLLVGAAQMLYTSTMSGTGTMRDTSRNAH